MPQTVSNGREWAYRLLGLASAAMALQEAESGHLGVNAGLLFGRRPAFLPLLPVAVMILVWLVQIGAGAAVAANYRRRVALVIAATATAVSLTQGWFNQKIFLGLTLFALALDSEELARRQLLLLYIASVLYKLRDGFWTGASLTAALTQIQDRGMSPWIVLPVACAPLLSKLALAGEALAPAALSKRPRLGVAGVVVLHLGFAACLPGLWPFTLTCAAAALLFLPAKIALE